MASWVEDNGYAFDGLFFNIYHVSPHETRNPEEFVTEVLLPGAEAVSKQRRFPAPPVFLQRVPQIPSQASQAQSAGKNAHAQSGPVPVSPVPGKGPHGAKHEQHRRHVSKYLPVNAW